MISLDGLARAVLVVTATLVLGACTHAQQSCVVPPGIYNPPIMVTPTLVSPASGATRVSTGPLDVTIGNAFNATALFVQDGTGNVTYATNFRIANPPSPDLRIGTFTNLRSQTTYKLYATVPGPFAPPSGCGPTPAVVALSTVLLGSFTTG